MTGIEYPRRKARLTKRELAKRSGLTQETILTYEKKGVSPGVPVDKLLALADVLGVKLDDLVAVYDGASLTTEDRPVRYSTINSPRNVINNYRIRKNLRFDELAQILGLADGECARVVCRRETARTKYICSISELEGLSPDEFAMRYSSPT